MAQTKLQAGGRAPREIETRARVVIVDDHPLWTESVQLALERTQRFRVVAIASSEQEGIELIRQNRPDIALVDVRLPSGNEGINVARVSKDVSPETKIVMFTGSEDPNHVREAIPLQIAGYLSKDIGILQLAHAVECIHAGLSVFSKLALAVLLHDEERNPSPLSRHQKTLLGLDATGLKLGEIAARIASSRSKVNRDLLAIQEVLGVKSRVEAIVAAVREGWV